MIASFFSLITVVCTNSDEQISTLNFCVKPELHPGTSVWAVIKPIRSFNSQSGAVSSPDYRMVLFPELSCFIQCSWCFLHFSWRGCNLQEVGGVFFWSLLREAFTMKAWRWGWETADNQLMPQKWSSANQMRFSFMILLCTRTLLIFLIGLGVLLLFHLQAETVGLSF